MLKRILVFVLCLGLLASTVFAEEWESIFESPGKEVHKNIEELPYLAEGQPDWKSIPDLDIKVEKNKLYFSTASGEPVFSSKNIRCYLSLKELKTSIRWDKRKKAYAIDLKKIEKESKNTGWFYIHITEPLEKLETADEKIAARRMEYQYYGVSGKLRKASYILSVDRGNFRDEYYLDYYPNAGYMHRLKKLYMRKGKIYRTGPLNNLGRYDLQGNHMAVKPIVPPPTLGEVEGLEILDFPKIEFQAGGLGGIFSISSAQPLNSAVLFNSNFHKLLNQRKEDNSLHSKKITKNDLKKLSQSEENLELFFDYPTMEDPRNVVMYKYIYSPSTIKEYAEAALKAKKNDGFMGEEFFQNPEYTYNAFMEKECDLSHYDIKVYENSVEVKFFDILGEYSTTKIYPKDKIE